MDEVIILDTVDFGGYSLRFNDPITIPIRKTDGGLFTASYEPFDLYEVAGDKDLLFAWIEEHFYFLWTEYAVEDDENLTEGGRLLKARLRNAMYEVE